MRREENEILKRILLFLVALLAFVHVFNGEAYLNISSKLIAIIMIILVAIVLVLESKQNRRIPK